GLGRGACLTLVLPCAVAAHEREEQKPEDVAAGATVRVLVVDDSSETVELLQIFFARRGYDVAGAGSAEEAIARAREKSPGIIISDISMPETDGYALLAELRRMPGLEAVPAIAFTGHAMDEDRERSLAAGFAVHLPKPVDPDELLRVVRQLTA
ncbi:MAG: response regulator, partial [Rubrivivax sp.]|nr:response regulator [Pyrinomonadaceae bacterium]